MCVALGAMKLGFKSLVLVVLLLCIDLRNHVAAVEKNYTLKILRKTCILKPDTGPCRGNILMHFFEPESGKCKRFPWGGCQGNGNRFDSKQECYDSCLGNSTTKTRPRYCFLNFDYGYCFGALNRYYYDRLYKVCKQRLYSGCGGNQNNFYSMEQCDSICRYGKGTVKSVRMKKGQVKKVIIINPPKRNNSKRPHNSTKYSTPKTSSTFKWGTYTFHQWKNSTYTLKNSDFTLKNFSFKWPGTSFTWPSFTYPINTITEDDD